MELIQEVEEGFPLTRKLNAVITKINSLEASINSIQIAINELGNGLKKQDERTRSYINEIIKDNPQFLLFKNKKILKEKKKEGEEIQKYKELTVKVLKTAQIYNTT